MGEQERPAWGMEPCCGGNRDDITQLDIRGDGVTVGIVGLTQVFEQLCAERLPAEESLGDRILAMVKAQNYVPRPAEGAYKAALLRAYAAYWTKKQSGR